MTPKSESIKKNLNITEFFFLVKYVAKEIKMQTTDWEEDWEITYLTNM